MFDDHPYYTNGKCELFEKTSATVFVSLYIHTGGYVCKGCFKEPYCKNTPKEVKKQGVKKPERTNAELADLMGTSKRQVSKMRKNGTLAEALKEFE
jgi:hypothetical protein